MVLKFLFWLFCRAREIKVDKYIILTNGCQKGHIYLDNALQILCKSLLCFAKIGKIDYSKIVKISLVKFCMFNFKILCLAQI